jgi:signal transduction histidine kinase/DNA-directed RNA polymerase subunit N (RpoN/RPB10)
MKLTKKLEAEIKQVMTTYWESYVQGDLRTWASFLTKNYRNIGTTQEEIWNTKTEIVDYTNAIIDQMVGMAEFRNKQVHIIPYDPYFMVHELGDLYIKINDNWSFYSNIRLSSLIQKMNSDWKILHQHGSYPDSKVQQGEAFGFDEVKAENIRLQEAVINRTAELEKKTRELEIESSLERVRTVAMGMRKPDDMLDVCQTIAQQLELLKVKEIRNVQTAIIYESKGTYLNYEFYVKHNKLLTTEVDYSLHPEHATFVNKMLESPEAFYTQGFTGKELKDWYAYQKTTPQFADSYLEQATSLNYYMYSIGGVVLGMSTYSPLREEEITLFKRFRNVFDLAYKRFEDIKKAEAQVKESQIQLGLERVRARTMAMQHSNELPEAATILFHQVQSLGMPAWSAGYCIWNEDKSTVTLWMSSAGVLQPAFTAPTTVDELFIQMRQGQEDGKTFHVVEMGGDKLAEHYNYMRTLPVVSEILDSIISAGHPLPSFQIMHHAYFSKGFLLFITYEPVPDAHDIFKRFGKVFDQTYTRFLDLQKAEAQTREARIEAALERTRTQSMLMQHSNELDEISKVFHEQLLNLDIDSEFSFVWLPDEKKNEHLFWATWQTEKGGRTKVQSKSIAYPMDLTEPTTLACIDDWKSGVSVHEHFIPPLEIQNFFVTWEELLAGAEKLKAEYFPDGIYYTEAFMKYGCFGIDIRRPLSEKEKAILNRFAIEFERAYTRFLDLQKAEAQAREAQIETALERVRSRSLAMHKSEELKEVIQVVYEQFNQLNILIEHTGFIIDYKEKDDMHIWLTDKYASPFQITIPYFDSPHWNSFIEAKEKGESFFVNQLSFEVKNKFYNDLFTLIPSLPEESKQSIFSQPGLAISTVLLENVGLYIENFSGTPYTDDENATLMRFGNVFQQTYTRFLDLQKAEAQTRESQIQLALERVRARTMAMQHSDELAEVSLVLDTQVRTLGIKTQGCAFNIYNETDSTEWFSSEMGAMPPYKTPRENLFLRYYEAGEKGESIHIEEFTGEACIKHYEYLSTVPGMGDGIREMLKAGGSLPTRQIDHAVYFKYGYLLFITLESVPEAHETFIRFAKVFEQTYTRFLDLQKAEAQALRAEQDIIEIKSARKKAEEALSELQLTQKQLIQSEKMASLGELTAGIAHEIQNPLNFVNNFSDVSTELVTEMNLEIEKGNVEEAKQLAQDLKQNLEKINHHGKRAGDIVKGMLQHSRTSSGQKELTDINALADEYLRLAYHGLKAKDKTFNAKFETNLDETSPKVNVIPQDIGRVILNLINNAFYAVNERLRQAQPDSNYEPTVVVTTKRADNKVLISVKDNGSGITEKIKDKIFQPFFTTKPTGQGTGLGLSLSYDIVKAHGGELSVETMEGEGSEFVIALPL